MISIVRILDSAPLQRPRFQIAPLARTTMKIKRRASVAKSIAQYAHKKVCVSSVKLTLWTADTPSTQPFLSNAFLS
jgi:hypothetical protein